jgi:hypothetical protein
MLMEMSFSSLFVFSIYDAATYKLPRARHSLIASLR